MNLSDAIDRLLWTNPDVGKELPEDVREAIVFLQSGDELLRTVRAADLVEVGERSHFVQELDILKAAVDYYRKVRR